MFPDDDPVVTRLPCLQTYIRELSCVHCQGNCVYSSGHREAIHFSRRCRIASSIALPLARNTSKDSARGQLATGAVPGAGGGRDGGQPTLRHQAPGLGPRPGVKRRLTRRRDRNSNLRSSICQLVNFDDWKLSVRNRHQKHSTLIPSSLHATK